MKSLLLLLSLANPALAHPCGNYTFEKLSSDTLEADLHEMSGLVRLKDGGLVHIQDSGNDPYLVFTTRSGKVTEKIKFSNTSADPEELDIGECPWSQNSCIYVFDIGDNFRWRSERNIWAIEESSLRSAKPRIENLIFSFPGNERIDSEATAIVGSTIYIFSKERKHSRVFALVKSAWTGGDRTARLIDDLPYNRITGAAATQDGSRILLLNEQFAVELSKDSSDSSFYTKRKKIKLRKMAQQEAIVYDDDQKSFLYTSEKSLLSRTEWGIMRAKCVPTP